MYPKQYLENIKLRNQAIGKERRVNMTKIILDHAPNFPLSVEYSDIDRAVYEWVENNLSITFEGEKLPTYKLFSNQKINEYAQSWKYLDKTGNLLMNFKTITRENNPKKGKNQGDNYNIPGNRDYPMFEVSTLQENGQEVIDLYSMKQPMSIDFSYSLNIITNKYELINQFNQLVNYQFKALECYISPNNHPMPMILEDISDESEYGIDDRKYYSQTYKFNVLGYIITKDDYKVTRLPSRWNIRFLGETNKKKKKVQIKEKTCPCQGQEENEERYANKTLELKINFPDNSKKAEFYIDTDMNIENIHTTNVYDFLMYINEEQVDLEETIDFLNGDKITINISKDKEFEDSIIVIDGYDPNTVLDNDYNPESSLDEQIQGEIINFKNKKE